MKWLNLSSIDWLLMIPVAILLVFSLATLLSIDSSFFKSQLLFTIISIGIFILLTQINPSVLRYYSVPIYFVSLLVLGAVLLFGIESRGSVRWFEFLGFRVQFSEILKPFLALSLASFLTNLRDYSLKSFFSVLIFLSPLVVLIFFQPDLGNALIYVMVTMLALLIYGFPYKWFFAGFLLWLASLPFFWLILHDYQKQRILTFINPSRDPLGTSYNAIQAVIAVGSGMILGKGLGQGTQAGLRFLPEQHTDFIFATISEELGFIGAVVIVICFAFIFFRLYQIIKNSDDKFSKVFSIIVFLIIFIHFAVNVGMNLAIVPIVGVTLPFVSYGGSSLLSNFILLGLLFAVNKKSRSEVLEIG
jgi:rod shape determining protein RodA